MLVLIRGGSNYPSLSCQIKLADFGFARHFKDEGHKPIDMTSLAGTPVFMVSLPRPAVTVEVYDYDLLSRVPAN